MALQIKYRTEFKDISNNDIKVDILTENGATPFVITNLIAAEDPLKITYPTTKKISYKRGSGCVISVISETDRQLLNLHTADMFQYQIRIYKNSVLEWIGYLDSEQYSEPYEENKNYVVTLTGNDGTNLLSRIKFNYGVGTRYTGIQNQWYLINLCISKLDLPYNYVEYGIGTTFTTGYDSVTASSNILKQTYVNMDNFYDEDGEPMTMDEVLKSTLEPYGLTWFQCDGSLYIIDLHTLYNSTITLQRFGLVGSYISTYSVNNVKDVSTIKWRSDKQNLDILAGINEQKISFSPYQRFEDYDTKMDNSDTLTYSTLWTSNVNGYYTNVASNSDWTTIGVGSFRGSKDDSDSKPEFYTYWTNGVDTVATATPVITYDGEAPYIIGDSNTSIWINFKSFIRTKTNPYDAEESGTQIQRGQVTCRVSIGNMYYDDIANNWTTDSTRVCYFNIGEYTQDPATNIADKWLDIRWGGKTMKLQAGLNGKMKFEFLSHMTTFDIQSVTSTERVHVSEIWYKDFSFKMINNITNSPISDKDIEYLGTLNKLWSDKGEDIKLTQGYNANGSVVCLGGLMYNNGTNYIYIDNWSRNGNTGTIEELLLNTIVSNYDGSTIQISGGLTNNFCFINTITDNTFMSGKKFLIVGGTMNYYTRINNVVLQEFKNDNLTINRY